MFIVTVIFADDNFHITRLFHNRDYVLQIIKVQPR